MDYFPRQLSYSDSAGDHHLVHEKKLLEIPGPKIVLGEPGMGKSELVAEFGRTLEVKPIAAIRFMLSKDPSKFVVEDRLLLIDGLDEAMARREGDAVDQILAKLEEAGSPQFILSCRAREWQARTATGLRQIYGAEPTVFTIEPLSRIEAADFLGQRFDKADALHVLGHLDHHRLTELYRNPLTLSLMGQVAERDAKLPATRAALFGRVCELIWPEHDADRQDQELGRISEDQALSAAGAMMTGLIFAGAEAISLAGPGQLQDGDVRLSEFDTITDTNAARVVFSSKLFTSIGPGRAKPIHRVVAEFLGARWLAKETTKPRAQRRLLAQLHANGGIPASLRGLNAWLAFHSSAISERVIAADPFGVLRYGETSELTVQQADCMFEALASLAEVDPYFRAQDWDSHTAPGLMIPALHDKIQSTIECKESNEHLRSLLIEGLKDTTLAVELAGTLEVVMMSSERFYREREAAADALFQFRDKVFWREVIGHLREQGTEDAARLARNLIEWIDCDVDDEILVAVLFAEMGVTISPLPRVNKTSSRIIRYYEKIRDGIPTSKLCSILNLLVEYATLVQEGDWESENDLVAIVSALTVRAIDERAVGVGDASLMWQWLGIARDSRHLNIEAVADLKSRLDSRDDLRRAIQCYGLYSSRSRSTIWAMEFDLGERMVSLGEHPKDVIWFLERLADADNHDMKLREDWRDLMRIGYGRNAVDPQIKSVGERFSREDVELNAFIQKLENPEKPTWKIKSEREEAEREAKRRATHHDRCKHYVTNRIELRAGEFNATYAPAKAYLGFFGYEVSADQSPEERVVEWLTPDLRDDALAGFEAVLHRADLPSSADVAKGFAEGKTWNYCFAIMAGLLARQRSGVSLENLDSDVLIVGLMLCYDGRWTVSDSHDEAALRSELESIIFTTDERRASFARLWIEPSLAAGRAHVRGLYMLAHEEQWGPVSASLAGDWLKAFPQVPEQVELELVDCITHAGTLEQLAVIATTRADTVFRNFDHMLSWLAIDVIARFDEVERSVMGIGAQAPEFIWFLRNRIQLERRGSFLPLTIQQAKWIVSEFRREWPYSVIEGSGWGDTNSYDATDFIRSLIVFIASDAGDEAYEAMAALIVEPLDTYSNLIRHMAAEQRQKRAEQDFVPLGPQQLGEILFEGPPANADDLKSLVLEELEIAQKKLLGEDVDQVRDFWRDDGVPREENRCRDRLAVIIGPELMRYDVQRLTEADMPQTKRVDLAFTRGDIQLPMEVKGQWHEDVWEAATDQLDSQYLIDWRSDQRGIYCVLWFGDLPSKSGRRLRTPPAGLGKPNSPDEMRKMLIERIPEARRSLIDVVVLDLVTGRTPKAA